MFPLILFQIFDDETSKKKKMHTTTTFQLQESNQ
jgi:hypothetical protein